jgi:predicted AlkP superfamily pyrophosphatase or phosphodiesterase
MSGVRHGAVLGLVGTLVLACAQGGAPPPLLELPTLDAPARPPAQVVLVSVSGLGADRYRATAGQPPVMPSLALLAESGVAADAMRSVAPAARYPAHATLLSGRRPAGHGIVADRRLGERGVRATPYWHASQLQGPILWQVASQAGLRVAALGWPSTLGASISLNVPDLEPARRGETWLGVLAGATTPEMLALLREAGGAAAAAQLPGSARDAVLVEVACRLLSSAEPPQLVLLHLSQTAAALAARGVDAPETRAAFGAADAGIAELVECTRAAGRLQTTAFVVVGDHGAMPVHTVVSPNAVLAAAGLLTPQQMGSDLVSWAAIVRSNGGSAFVYAKGGEDALLAREALGDAASRTAAFRLVSADEMLRVGADPDAWFGLEAEPGFAFRDDVRGPLLRPATARSSWGYLPHRPEMDAGFVAWGAGLRSRVRVPFMRQTDVAPTLAPLLGLELEDAEGRVLVGLLRLPRVAAVPVHEEDGR